MSREKAATSILFASSLHLLLLHSAFRSHRSNVRAWGHKILIIRDGGRREGVMEAGRTGGRDAGIGQRGREAKLARRGALRAYSKAALLCYSDETWNLRRYRSTSPTPSATILNTCL